jgi:hypothetical protein
MMGPPPSVAAEPGVADERGWVDPVLEAAAMRAPLLAAFGLPAATPCHVVDAKYEAGSYCTVLYQLGDQLVTGVLTFDGPGPSGGVPVGSRMRAFAFPDDPKLSGLVAAMAPHTITAALDWDDRTRVETTLLRYRPGKRATIRFDLRGPTAALALIGKVYASEAKATAVFDETRGLAPALADDSVLRIAPAEALLPEIPMVLWRPIEGADLEPQLDTRRGVELVGAAAAAIAALHVAPVVSQRRRPGPAEVVRFRHRATNAHRVAPDVGFVLLAWTDALEADAHGLDDAPSCLVHGDCKPSQFRVTDRALALLDFDHCGIADPASDVGTFLASLRQRSRRALEDPFLDAYVRAMPNDPDVADRARWYMSAALLRKALRAFARSPRSPVPGILAVEGNECLRSRSR